MPSSSTRDTAFERKILRLYTIAWCYLLFDDPRDMRVDLVDQFADFIDLDFGEFFQRSNKSYDTVSRPAIRSFGLFENQTDNERFWDDAMAESAKPRRICERFWVVSDCVLDASTEMMRTGRRTEATKFEKLSRDWKILGDKAMEEDESRKEES